MPNTKFGGTKLNNTNQPPCMDVDLSPDIKICCDLFNSLFHRDNIKEIMMLMKHSLEYSKPWIQEYDDDTDLEGENELWVEKALDRIRIEGNDEKFRNALPMNGQFDFLKDFG